jgi:aryl-alcohol dehydrogenase-like predicted oxidoreductase
MQPLQQEPTMSKRYSTTYSNGHTAETSSAHEAHNFANYGSEQTFRIAGALVSAAEFFAATAAAVQAAWDKKAETHRRVSVQHGATHLGRVEKWLRK